MNFAGWFFIFAGLTFTAIAGIGLLKMPQFLLRVQVVSKAATLGTIFCLIGVGFLVPSLTTVIKVFVIILFLLISTPTSTHAMGESSQKIKYH